jgi:hypothetical protein
MSDDAHEWLRRLRPEEWVRAGLRELSQAREASARHSARPALASARRAAGMGWNAVLALELEPDSAFGRSFVDHLRALAEGVTPRSSGDPAPLPDEVRDAARLLLDDPAGGEKGLVPILTRSRDDRLLAAAETILAEAYARVVRRRPASTGASK